MTLDATILVCTRNRDRSLRQTLAALCEVCRSRRNMEVVVVDNGSIDTTQEVIASFARSLPLRTITVSRPGQSRAANAGLRAAQGRWVLLTDDDARPEPGWADTYLEVADSSEEVGYMCGAIRPCYQGPAPDRALRMLAPASTGGRVVDEVQRFATPGRGHDLIGVNAAVRLDLALRFGFDERLGPGTRWVMNGADTLLGRQILAAGYLALLVPRAEVEHLVDPHRLSLAFMARRKRFVGRASLAYDDTPATRSLPRAMRDALTRGVEALRSLRFKSSSPSAVLAFARAVGVCEGHVLGFSAIRREAFPESRE